MGWGEMGKALVRAERGTVFCGQKWEGVSR